MSWLISLCSSVFYSVFLAGCLAVLGSLGLMGLQDLVNSEWMKPLMPSLERLSSWLIPLTFCYPLALWAILGHHLPEKMNKPSSGFHDSYVTPLFFALRGILYLSLWHFAAWRVRHKRRLPGALSLILVLFSGSFAMFDWAMALEPEWSSTAVGMILTITGTLFAFNFSVRSQFQSAELPSDKMLQDWNTFQLTLAGIWTYLATMQWITVWSGNLPRETQYFLHRGHGPWLVLIALIILFQSIIPIPSLFFRSLKQSAVFSRRLPIVFIICQTAYLFWVIGPPLWGYQP